MEQKPSFWNTADRKSLDDVTPEEWDEVSRPARYTQGDIESVGRYAQRYEPRRMERDVQRHNHEIPLARAA